MATKVAVKLVTATEVFEADLKQHEHGGVWLESSDLCTRLAALAKTALPSHLGKKPVAFVPLSQIEWIMSSSEKHIDK